MIKFKVGKYYCLDYKKALKTYDVLTWPTFKYELELFKKGPVKCVKAEYCHKIFYNKSDFVYTLMFEGSKTGSWGYTKSLISCFREKNSYVQEDMDI